MSAAAKAAVAAIRVYQYVVSPLMPPACRFAPTCSEYARVAIADCGVVRGGLLALWRLARCHPFNPGGFDPPPSGRRRG